VKMDFIGVSIQRLDGRFVNLSVTHGFAVVVAESFVMQTLTKSTNAALCGRWSDERLD